jgi:histidine triad (HIT) family protein
MNEKCTICDIIDGNAAVRILRDEPDFIAYRSPTPLAPVHIILAPKEHYALNALDAKKAQVLAAIFALLPELARENSIFQCGFRIVASCGPDAGEEDGHLHFHLLGGTRLTDCLA